MLMNKYLITVIVPSIETEFNVLIPNNKKIGTVKKIIINAIKELSSDAFKREETEVQFIDRDTGKNFLSNVYVKDSGIKNGTRVIVI